MSSLTDLPLITAPGGLWSYCNSGYIVLGRVIEVLTGMTYEQALTTRLLEPLGAKDTLFFPGDMVTHSLAVGHVREGDSPAVVAPKWEMSRAAGPAGADDQHDDRRPADVRPMHLAGGVAADGTRVLSEASTRGDAPAAGRLSRAGAARRPLGIRLVPAHRLRPDWSSDTTATRSVRRRACG